MRSRRWRTTAGLCLGRGARTRALLLDAISAGQVVLEDVRAARLAGLRMVVCDQIVIGSFCGQARNVQQTAEMRGFVVRASLVEKRSIFKRARRPPLRTRRLTFLKAGRGHTTSSSSAITIAKMDQRSCSINYQPRKCVHNLAVSTASRRLWHKMALV